MRGVLSKAVETIGEFVFPSALKCLFCKEAATATGYCASCYDQLDRAKELGYCRRCGRLGSMVEECFGCLGDSHFYTCARGVGPYEDLWKAVLYQFKYRGKVSLGKPMGELMTEIILKDKRYHGLDVIVPVPISSEKAEDRLFNQAELLAWQVGSYIRRPLCPEVLYRKGGTKIQAKLSKEERKRNLHNAYGVTMKQDQISLIQGRDVLLVDDVLTTGGTASLCSKLLLELGAKEVKVLTWATGSSSVKKTLTCSK